MVIESMHILLVEDEEAHVELARAAFESQHQASKLTVCANLAESRAFLSRSRPDLVLANFTLPDGRGTELIPPDSESGGFPVVLMNTHEDDRVAVEAIKAGALDYVVKSEVAFAEMPRVAERALREWKQIVERKRTEETLRNSEERLRILFECAPDGYYLNDLKGNFVDANRAAEQIVGYKKEELIGRSFLAQGLKLVRARDIPKAAALLAKSVLGKPTGPDELTLNRKDGTQVTVEVRSYPVTIDGQRLVLGIARDVTARKRAEEALKKTGEELEKRVRQRTAELVETTERLQREIADHERTASSLQESEQQLRGLFEGSPDAIFVEDPDGHVLHVNPAACRLHGMNSGELVGKHILDLVPPERRDEVRRVFPELVDGSLAHVDGCSLTKDGRAVPVELRAAPISYLGQPAVLLHVRDIADRKQAEETLRESEERYRLVAENASDVIWTCDLDFQWTYISPSVEFLLGYTADEAMRKTLDELATPASVALARKTLAKMLASAEEDPDVLTRPVKLEAEQIRKDGSTVWVEVNVSFLLADDGRPVGITGVTRDITERKRAEMALLASEARNRTLVQGSPVCIKIVDLDSRLQYMSAAGREQLKIPDVEPFYGCTFPPDFYPEPWKRLANEHLERAKSGEVSTVECCVLDMEGSALWYDTTFVPSRDKEGRIDSVIVTSVNITERKRAETELQESETKFKAVFENAGGAVFIADVDTGEIVDCNLQAEELLGRSRAEIVGLHQSQLHPVEEAERYKQVFADHVACGSAKDRELEVVHRDGRKIPVLIAAQKMRLNDKDLVVGFFLDITDRQRAEESLRRSELELSAIYENAPMVMLVVDSERRVRKMNDPAVAMSRRPAEQSIGLRGGEALRCVHATDTSEGCGFGPDCESCGVRNAVLDTFRTGKGCHGVEASIPYDANGAPIDLWVLVSTAPLIFSGQDMVLVCLEDITQIKKAEEEKRALERQVQHAQKLESLGVLAGGIAHDFNNLLMGILGNADLALNELSPVSPARRNLQEIEKASRRAADLAKQMLAYSGKGRFVVQPINGNELVEEMAHLLEVSISKKNVLKFNFAENLPIFDGDATQIRQVVMNLITNASEAIGERSGIIALSTGAIHCDRAYLDNVSEMLRAALGEPLPEGVYTYFEVADTGCGMDAETIEKIFDPFFTTKFTGRGLGMSAVLGIVRGHKGALKIHSETKKGTTFRLLFPANELPNDGVAVAGKGEAPRQDWRGSGTVLFADDEEVVRTVGSQMLERLGFNVLTAPDGREALKVFGEHPAEIVCMFLDLTMPHLDGEETFSEIRRLSPDVPVILCSGYDEQDATRRFAGKGLAGFIQKPFTIAALKEKLMDVLAVGEDEQ